ncbi:short coiled-coil protein A isoform X3 [Octopus sinensis]|uniref:Short coiled-coil protein A isoform X3 n=1 Tax=Octopus sinensis TaxID=2607531 RepID=A0A6P7TKY0_9MOLL|nr:short coiled-coil protein A isoform X3 [Octopus sinensis]
MRMSKECDKQLVDVPLPSDESECGDSPTLTPTTNTASTTLSTNNTTATTTTAATITASTFPNISCITPTTINMKIIDDVSSDSRSEIYSSSHSLAPDMNRDEEEEKHRLISQVLELQNTLDDLSTRVDSVKEENLKLKSENQVLGQYIENLMSASSVFQSTSPAKAKKKPASGSNVAVGGGMGGGGVTDVLAAEK